METDILNAYLTIIHWRATTAAILFLGLFIFWKISDKLQERSILKRGEEFIKRYKERENKYK